MATGLSQARVDRLPEASEKSFAQINPEAGGIKRFARIHPGLARGGEPYEQGIRYLKESGYKTVVSFLYDSEESTQVVRSGMRYINIPMRSSFFSADPPSDEQVNRFLTVVKDSTLYPIFIHCHAGKDRTGAMSAIYRMEVCGWSTEEAIEEMKSFGFAGRYRRLQQYVSDYSRRPAAPTLATQTKAGPALATETKNAPELATESKPPFAPNIDNK